MPALEAFVAGAALSDGGEVGPGWTPVDLMAQAAHRALADAGVALEEVDGVAASSTQLPWAPANLVEALGIAPRWTDGTMVGGSSPIAQLNHARAALHAGLAEVVLIAYGSTQRSVGRAKASVQEVSPYEAPVEPMLPVMAYALAASRHMWEHGTTPEQLAWVAVAARRWAQRTPGAWATKDLTVDDVLRAPRLCEPLGVKDCCLITDGGGALVLTKDPRGPGAVRVLGVGETATHRHVSSAPSLTVTGAAASGATAYAEAGVSPSDVDCAQLYDAFTITPVLFAEDLGLCERGEGGAFFEGGRTGPDGDGLPVNTTGGGLSFQHPGMNGMHLLVEGVRQVRAGRRCVLVHGNGGVLTSQCTALLGGV